MELQWSGLLRNERDGHSDTDTIINSLSASVSGSNLTINVNGRSASTSIPDSRGYISDISGTIAARGSTLMVDLSWTSHNSQSLTGILDDWDFSASGGTPILPTIHLGSMGSDSYSGGGTILNQHNLSRLYSCILTLSNGNTYDLDEEGVIFQS